MFELNAKVTYLNKYLRLGIVVQVLPVEDYDYPIGVRLLDTGEVK